MKLEKYSEEFKDILISNGVNFKDNRGVFKKTIFGDELVRLMGPVYELITVKSDKNVIRGLHFQKPPHPVSKFITCIYGEIQDVFVDIRKGSKTFGKHGFIKLREDDSSGIFIPKGFAHGYSVLSDVAIVAYLQSDNYYEELDESINPLSLNINWKVKNPTISKKDKSAKNFNEFESSFE